jgi:PAS domain-containing protein
MRICAYSARPPRSTRHFSSRAKRPKDASSIDLGNGQWNRPRLRELLGSALFKSESFHDFEVEHDFPHIGHRTMRLNARRIPRRDPQQKTLLLAIEDVTERREIAEIRFQRLFETAKDGMVVVDVETLTVEDVNPFFLRMTGLHREDLIAKERQRGGRSTSLSGVLRHRC